MGHFLGFFTGGLHLFDPKIALRYARDNRDKKVSASSKKPLKCPMICCACEKKYPGLSKQRYNNS
jgi:hypothetical protein